MVYNRDGFEASNFGALGTWEKLEEEFDESIVKQKDGTCVSAVGEMLAKYHGLNISQDEIIEGIGPWSNSQALTKYLNLKENRKGVIWRGGFFEVDEFEYIAALTESIGVWGVMLRDSQSAGHAVLIYGFDEKGLIKIKDPYDQTNYKMTVDELYRVLSEYVVVVKNYEH